MSILKLKPVTSFHGAPPKLIKMIRCGRKSWLHVSMQQVCDVPVHKLNETWVGAYSKSSQIKEIQVDE